jgi:hypothetical protein
MPLHVNDDTPSDDVALFVGEPEFDLLVQINQGEMAEQLGCLPVQETGPDLLQIFKRPAPRAGAGLQWFLTSRRGHDEVQKTSLL